MIAACKIQRKEGPTMKVILKDYVYKHGVAGDVVNVAPGFARNYLIPRGLAVQATAGALRENQHLIKTAVKARAELKNLESEVAAKIHNVELVFGVKAGKNNKLYGSITTIDIARALEEKTGVDINRRRISERTLRELGVHNVPVRISHDVSPVLRVVILREEEVADYLDGKPVPTLVEVGEMEETEAVEEATDAEATMDADEALFDIEAGLEQAAEEDDEEAVEDDDELIEDDLDVEEDDLAEEDDEDLS
jgi:large subunit ribosomal protein L9